MQIVNFLKNIFSRSDWVKTVKFKLIDVGPIVRGKYVDLHAFGDEVLHQEDLPNGIVYIGPKDKGENIEVVYNKNVISIEEIRQFLKRYRIEFVNL
ncbi:MAG: hypothetical protein PHR36_03090 [Patescibacteria group bacterium]|nr:hypothetical protein [Patescibacteria group bacterium]